MNKIKNEIKILYGLLKIENNNLRIVGEMRDELQVISDYGIRKLEGWEYRALISRNDEIETIKESIKNIENTIHSLENE